MRPESMPMPGAPHLCGIKKEGVKEQMKKALALFLTLALLISMLPTASLAVEDKTPETTSEAQSAEEQAKVVVTEEEQ